MNYFPKTVLGLLSCHNSLRIFSLKKMLKCMKFYSEFALSSSRHNGNLKVLVSKNEL